MNFNFNFGDHEYAYGKECMEWLERYAHTGVDTNVDEWETARRTMSYIKDAVGICQMRQITHDTSVFRGNTFLVVAISDHSCTKLRVFYEEGQQRWVEHLRRMLLPVDKSKMLKWFYKSPRGLQSEYLPLVGKDPLPEFYPWIPDLDKLYDDFAGSNANVLLLIGPPGTGKTTFIRGLLRRTNLQAWVTYDPGIQNDDNLYIRFASISKKDHENEYWDESSTTDDDPSGRLLVLEDSDSLLESRKEGNVMMNRLLNLSDGLISLPSRKLVFSTNLPSLSSVDPAILRPGRCFAVIKFRNLTAGEAARACSATAQYDRAFLDGTTYSLAEALNNKRQEDLNVVRRIGFV